MWLSLLSAIGRGVKTMACTAMMLSSACAFAQQKSVLRFEALVDNDTIMQGNDFTVTYRLVSTECKDWAFEDCAAFEVQKNFYDTKDLNENGIHYYATNNCVVFRNYGTGVFRLPQCTVNVGGEVFSSSQKTIYVKPSDEYGTEYAHLRDHLRKFANRDIDQCRLHATTHKNITVFNDFDNRISGAVANGLENTGISPVLYWSVESCWDMTKSAGFHIEMLDYYDSIIEEVKKNNVMIGCGINSYRHKSNYVEPLLKGIKYGQDEPYNSMAPLVRNKKPVIGCVPTAMAQILARHKHPENGTGTICYKTTYENGEHIVRREFSDVRMNWKDDFMEDYTTTTDTGKTNCISRLMTALSGSVCADFEEKATAAAINNVKMSLINFWGYSPSMRLCQSSNADTICGLIMRDLDNDRVCFVSTNSHSFLCDGHQGDFLHFNLGWKGYCNGYYQALMTEKSKMTFPIKHAIVGIEPDYGKEMKKDIMVKNANTLSDLLTKEEIDNVTTLTIKGVLGNADIALIRQMAGAPADDRFAQFGKLRHLDLSGASFQTDSLGHYYKRALTGSAGKTTVTRTTTKGGRVVSSQKEVLEFNYDTMTPADWEKFKQLKMHTKPGARVECEGGKYVLYCFTQSGIISPSMFCNCENLASIILPDNVTSFKDNCFNHCASLKELNIPDNVTELGDYSLHNTTLLEKIELNEKLKPYIQKATKKANPDVKLVFRKNT